MDEIVRTLFKDAFHLVFKRPRYLLLGFFAFFPGNLPFLIRPEETFSFFSSLSIALGISVESDLKTVSAFFVGIILLLFCINIIAFSWICLDILSQKKKRPLKKLFPALGKALPRIALIRILGYLFFTLFLSLLFLPVQALFDSDSALSGILLGVVALGILLRLGPAFVYLFLFAHFYTLFAQLPWIQALKTSATLFTKHSRAASIFLLYFVCLLLLIALVTMLLPGFEIRGFSLSPLFPGIPFFVTIFGCLLSGTILLISSSFFPIVLTLFFLSLASRKKSKKSIPIPVQELISPMLKKKSELPQETKYTRNEP